MNVAVESKNKIRPEEVSLTHKHTHTSPSLVTVPGAEAKVSGDV